MAQSFKRATILRSNKASQEAHVLVLTNIHGGQTTYGVFATYADAVEFGRRECEGFDTKPIRLAVVERCCDELGGARG